MLLLPTLVCGLIARWDWPIVVFALGIVLAAFLESCLVVQPDHNSLAITQDPIAIRVASLVGVLLIAIFWIAQVEHHVAAQSSLGASWLGGLVMLTGIGLRITAIRTLGASFVSDICCDARIEQGIYRWMSHPGEVGMLMIVVGATLLLAAPVAMVICFVACGPISWWRIQRENELLRNCQSIARTPEFVALCHDPKH